jgi:hypothetical protein
MVREPCTGFENENENIILGNNPYCPKSRKILVFLKICMANLPCTWLQTYRAEHREGDFSAKSVGALVDTRETHRLNKIWFYF